MSWLSGLLATARPRSAATWRVEDLVNSPSGVMAGGHVLGAKLACLDQQGVELDELVAADARVGCAAAGVRLDEVFDDLVLEHVAEVQDVVSNIQFVGHAACVL